MTSDATPPVADAGWDAAVAHGCTPAEVDGRRVLRVRRRIWVDGEGDWFDRVVQYLYAERRASTDIRSVHDDLLSWPEETRGWALLAFAVAGLDVRAWRATVRLGPMHEVPDHESAALPSAPNAQSNPTPLFESLDRVDRAERAYRIAEAERVVAARDSWREARAEEDRPGASGTPFQVGYFLDLSLKLGVADTTAKTMVHIAEQLTVTTPIVWRTFATGGSSWRAMQIVSAHIDGLDPALLPEFDRRANAKIASTALAQLNGALRILRERLQATSADERHDRARARRRVLAEPVADGMAWLHAYLPVASVFAVMHQLDRAATSAVAVPGETRGVAQVKADVFEDFITAFLRADAQEGDETVEVPGRRGVQPEVVVLIPAMTALGHSTVPPVLQGYGPIGIRTALRLAGDATSWIRVLTDPFTGAVTDIGRTRYRPTRHMRTLLRVLDGGGRGPGCTRAPEDTEMDHVQSFRLHDEDGDTSVENLVLLSRKHHGAKTAGELRYRLLPDRTVVLSTRTGSVYVTRPAVPMEPTPIPVALTAPEDAVPF